LVVGIPLPLGVVGHEGSTIVVVLNGLRLLAYGGDLTFHARTDDRDPDARRRTAPQYQLTTA
jgi:hypothetical protein